METVNGDSAELCGGVGNEGVDEAETPTALQHCPLLECELILAELADVTQSERTWQGSETGGQETPENNNTHI